MEIKDLLSQVDSPGGFLAIIVVLIPVAYKLLRIVRSDQRTDKSSFEQDEFRTILLNQIKELKDENENLIREKIKLSNKLYRSVSSIKAFKLNVSMLNKILLSTISDPTIIELITKLLSFDAIYDSDDIDLDLSAHNDRTNTRENSSE